MTSWIRCPFFGEKNRFMLTSSIKDKPTIVVFRNMFKWEHKNKRKENITPDLLVFSQMCGISFF